MQTNQTSDGYEALPPEPVDTFQVSTGPDIQHYVQILWHRKWLMMAVFLIVFSVVAIRTYRTRPIFRATTTVMIDRTNRGNILNQFAMPYYYQDNQAANQIHLLHSAQMRQHVAASVPDSLVQHARAVFPKDTTVISPAQLAWWISVSAQPVRDTDVLAISVTSPSPVLSTAFANLYAEVFQRVDMEQGRQDVSSTRRFIEEQLNVVGRRLDLAEIGLEEFKKENRFVNLSAETQALISQQSNLAVGLASVETELEGAQAKLTHVRTQIDAESAGMSQKLESVSSPLLLNFKSSLENLEVERANILMQGYKEDSERVQRLNRQIAEMRTKLAEEAKRLLDSQGFIEPVGRLRDLWETALELETGMTSINARKRILEAAVIDMRAKLRDFPELERTFAKLTRDVEADRAVYAMLSQRYEEARIQEAGRISSVRIVDRAQGAGQVQPLIHRDLSLGALVALVLAVVIGFGIDYLDTTVRGPEDVERRGLAVLANIPLLPGKTRWGKNPITSHLVTHAEPSSSGSEAFRVLRTNLLFSAVGTPCTMIAVTSAEPGEGKSTTTVNLGATLAQAGHRTLLIDADLRAPVLHSVFQHARKPGFSDVVVFDIPPAEVVFETTVEKLFCMTSGTIPPSPSDVLSSARADKALTELRALYDYILIDTPPALLAADTSIISSRADGVILVVRPGATSRHAVESSVKHLLQSGSRILGCVMNGLKPTGRYGGYYYYYYSGYDYKYHYARRRKDLDDKTVDDAVIV